MLLTKTKDFDSIYGQSKGFPPTIDIIPVSTKIYANLRRGLGGACLKMADISVSSLEREMVSALEADRRYQRENDAKFRAIHQRVGTYEEFRYYS